MKVQSSLYLKTQKDNRHSAIYMFNFQYLLTLDGKKSLSNVVSSALYLDYDKPQYNIWCICALSTTEKQVRHCQCCLEEIWNGNVFFSHLDLCLMRIPEWVTGIDGCGLDFGRIAKIWFHY